MRRSKAKEPPGTGGTGDVVSGPDRAERKGSSLLRSVGIRTQVTVLVALPLAATAVLGATVASEAFKDSASAATAAQVARLAAPALDVAHRLQDERDLTGLVEVGAEPTKNLTAARAATDQAVAALRGQLDEVPAGSLDPAAADAVDNTERTLASLAVLRKDRDGNVVEYDPSTVEGYQSIIRAVLGVVDSSGSGSTDPTLVRTVDAVSAFAGAGAVASQERGYLSYLLGSGKPLDPDQGSRLAVLIGTQDLLLADALDTLADEQAAQFRRALDARQQPVLTNRTLAAGRAAPGVAPADWFSTATNRLGVLRDTEDRYAAAVVDRAESRAVEARRLALVTAGLSIAVLSVTVWLALLIAGGMAGRLRRMRSAALEAARDGLPAIVERIRDRGPSAVREVEQPLRADGRDEIAQVATAFNDVHSTAVRIAGEQALLRQNLDAIVVNLSRRTQSLVERQLDDIEDLETAERDPDQLAALFRIDHLATRVKRHAESLLVLAGVDASRRATEAVSVLEVVRAAAGEVEQYARVNFGVLSNDLIAPHAVDDVVHLLAELLDNATEFSPPSTKVTIASQMLHGGGLRLAVIDQGVGMSEEDLAGLNTRLLTPGDIDVAASRTLGLYVVARLAARHGIGVRLTRNSTRGLAAYVDLPVEVVMSPLDVRLSANERRAALSGGGDVTGAPAPLAEPTAEQRATGPALTAPEPARAPSRGALESRSPMALPAAPVVPVAEVPPVAEEPAEDEAEAATQPAASEPEVHEPEVHEVAPAEPPAYAVAAQPEPEPAAEAEPQPSPVAPAYELDAEPDVEPEPQPEPVAEEPAPPVVAPEGESPIFAQLRSAWFRRDLALGGDGGSLPVPEPAAPPAVPAAANGHPTGHANGHAHPLPQRAPAARLEEPRTPDRPADGDAAAPAIVEPVAVGGPVHSSDDVWASPADAGFEAASVAASGASSAGTTAAGLPVRTRGATVVPGAIEPSRERGRDARDASAVKSTLSSLQRGVSRGRDVARSPDDPSDDA